MLYNKRNEYIKEGQIVYNKKRDILAFAVFFIGLWSIPFWYAYILDNVIKMCLSLVGFTYNSSGIFNSFVILYSGISILLGISGCKDENNENYMKIIFFMSIIVGILSILYLVFVR